MTAHTVLRFRGARALSDFRLAKLVQELGSAQPALNGLRAEFWHFVEADAAPDAGDGRAVGKLDPILPAEARDDDAGAGRSDALVRAAAQRLNSASSLAAQIKSFSDRPPMA